MKVSLGTNIPALKVCSELSRTGARAERCYERLSSGMRITRASDDAAGLAIAEQLKANVRISTRAIMNVSDGLSLLHIAQKAAQELCSITFRFEELAAESANGTYSDGQRKALQSEMDALVDEYNRIVETTSFNGLRLFDRTNGEIRIQAGIGEENTIAISIGQQLGRTIGAGSTMAPDGTFSDSNPAYAAPASSHRIVSADFNGDGLPDIAAARFALSSSVAVLLANPDGSFQSALTRNLTRVLDMTTGDFNEDGKTDIAVGTETGAYVMLGNNDGTFGAAQTVFLSADRRDVEVCDLNRDGHQDLLVLGASVGVCLGNGDGSFAVPVAYGLGGASASGMATGDFNGDGVTDVVVSAGTGNLARVLLGKADGTLNSYSTINMGANNAFPVTGDINNDGFDDLLFADYYNGQLLRVLAKGDGSGAFEAAEAVAAGASASKGVVLGDFNRDGNLDVAASDPSSNKVTVLIGDGQGNFDSAVQYDAGSSPRGVAAADFNGDGAIDLAAVNYTDGLVSLITGNLHESGGTAEVATISEINIGTVEAARNAIEGIRTIRESLSLELGNIGAFQERLETAVENLRHGIEQEEAARSAILDADFAVEFSTLVREQILRQTGAAALAHAKQQPALTLDLLRSI